MQFIDLAAQQKRIKDKIDANVQAVLKHGKYIMGPEVSVLEEHLSEYVGSNHGIACSSGTDALLLALMSIGVGPGDAVFTTPFTFIATAEVISLLGATPVFVDIDPITYNIDPKKLETAITALKTNNAELHPLPALKSVASNLQPNAAEGAPLQSPTLHLSPTAIIAVDLFGLPADYDHINVIAKKHNLMVIEDAAQSFGADYNGDKAGSLADIACTSFFPAKPLGCYGDGGMCFTDDEKLAQIMRSLMVHGKGSHKYDNARIGINGRLDTIQAAILLAKFDIFPEEIELRNQVASRYRSLLEPLTSNLTPLEAHTSNPAGSVVGGQRSEAGGKESSLQQQKLIPQTSNLSSGASPHITLPQTPPGFRSVWAQYSILAGSKTHRAEIQQKLKDEGIPTAIYYPKPLHLQTAFSDLGYQEGDFPVSEDCAKRIFSIPMHAYITEAEQRRIASVVGG